MPNFYSNPQKINLKIWHVQKSPRTFAQGCISWGKEIFDLQWALRCILLRGKTFLIACCKIDVNELAASALDANDVLQKFSNMDTNGSLLNVSLIFALASSSQHSNCFTAFSHAYFDLWKDVTLCHENVDDRLAISLTANSRYISQVGLHMTCHLLRLIHSSWPGQITSDHERLRYCLR